MKKLLILTIIALIGFGCTKEEVQQIETKKEVTYSVTGDRLFYNLKIADENGNELDLGYLKGSQSVTVTANKESAVFLEFYSHGYSYGTEIEIKVNGQRVDYWIGDPNNGDVVFLSY